MPEIRFWQFRLGSGCAKFGPAWRRKAAATDAAGWGRSRAHDDGGFGRGVRSQKVFFAKRTQYEKVLTNYKSAAYVRFDDAGIHYSEPISVHFGRLNGKAWLQGMDRMKDRSPKLEYVRQCSLATPERSATASQRF
jgi:hypothetical protein